MEIHNGNLLWKSTTDVQKLPMVQIPPVRNQPCFAGQTRQYKKRLFVEHINKNFNLRSDEVDEDIVKLLVNVFQLTIPTNIST